jgi:hypothetical protein
LFMKAKIPSRHLFSPHKPHEHELNVCMYRHLGGILKYNYICAFVQVQDYGCAVKMDQGRRVVLGQAKLLKLFMLLRGKDTYEYEKAILASLLVWARNKRGKSFLWKMFKQNACAFNEEAGEVAFSVLARQVSKGGLRADLEACDKAFKLSKVNIQVADDFNVDLCGDHMGDTKRFTINVDDDSVNATVAFFEEAVRKILANRYREYDDDYGKVRRNDRARVTVPMANVETKFQEDSKTLLETAESKLIAYINGRNLSKYRHMWPVDADDQVDAFMASEEASEDESNNVQIDQSPENVVVDVKRNNRNSSKRVLDVISEQESSSDAPLSRMKKTNISPRRRKKTKYTRIIFNGTRREKETLVGTILAVKAFKFGPRKWANQVFRAPSSAVLHMQIDKIVSGSNWAYCTMLHHPQSAYAKLLNTKEVCQFACKPGCEHHDTPFENGYVWDASDDE